MTTITHPTIGTIGLRNADFGDRYIVNPNPNTTKIRDSSFSELDDNARKIIVQNRPVTYKVDWSCLVPRCGSSDVADFEEVIDFIRDCRGQLVTVVDYDSLEREGFVSIVNISEDTRYGISITFALFGEYLGYELLLEPNFDLDLYWDLTALEWSINSEQASYYSIIDATDAEESFELTEAGHALIPSPQPSLIIGNWYRLFIDCDTLSNCLLEIAFDNTPLYWIQTVGIHIYRFQYISGDLKLRVWVTGESPIEVVLNRFSIRQMQW